MDSNSWCEVSVERDREGESLCILKKYDHIGDGRNPAPADMVDIPLFFPGFVHPRLFGISSINSIPWTKPEISGIRHNSKGGKPWQTIFDSKIKMTSWLAADLSDKMPQLDSFHDLALRSKECPIYGVFDWHKGVKHGRHLVWPLTWGWKLSVVGQILIDSILEIVKTLLIFWKGVVGMWLLSLFFVFCWYIFGTEY